MKICVMNDKVTAFVEKFCGFYSKKRIIIFVFGYL